MSESGQDYDAETKFVFAELFENASAFAASVPQD